LRPEYPPACIISAESDKKVVSAWTDHQIYWESLTGFRKVKGYSQKPPSKEQEAVKTKQNPIAVVDTTRIVT
jgi:hypothetical protein